MIAQHLISHPHPHCQAEALALALHFAGGAQSALRTELISAAVSKLRARDAAVQMHAMVSTHRAQVLTRARSRAHAGVLPPAV